MKGILKIEQLPNGAHQNQLGQIGTIPDGWAVIPDDMKLPQTFPFVDIEAEEITHYREIMVEREVTKTREVLQYDEEGNALLDDEGNRVMVTEEYTEMEMVTEQEPYTIMTVTSMAAGVMPQPGPEWEPEEENTVWDELDEAYREGVNEV